MDIKNRVMGDQPNDFLHKIASIVPGYHGYVDREKRRDADKILRTQLAHQYTAQHTRLTRAQQNLLSGHDLANISQVDRLAGLLQRFIDRLQNATYGYAGLFDPIKVEAAELDQLYAFDMALAGGVDEVSGAVDALESAVTGEVGKAEMPAALDRLSTVINSLNDRLNQRADLLTSGNRVPDDQYRALVNGLQGQAGSSAPVPESATPMHTSSSMERPRESGPGSSVSTGAPTVATGSITPDIGGYSSMSNSMEAAGAMSDGGKGDTLESPTTEGPVMSAGEGQYSGAQLPADSPSIASGGTPTERISYTATMPPGPDVDSMAEGNQGFAGEPGDVAMGGKGGGPLPLGEGAGSGLETASSPAIAPNAPGEGVVGGMEMVNNMDTLGTSGTVTGTSPGMPGTTGRSDASTLSPGTSTTGPMGSDVQS